MDMINVVMESDGVLYWIEVNGLEGLDALVYRFPKTVKVWTVNGRRV
jgi:hypothetical protein